MASESVKSQDIKPGVLMHQTLRTLRRIPSSTGVGEDAKARNVEHLGIIPKSVPQNWRMDLAIIFFQELSSVSENQSLRSDLIWLGFPTWFRQSGCFMITSHI